MTGDQARQRSVEYFLVSADESLESAVLELSAGHNRFAMNRLYYACFYSASAVLLNEGRHFVKHSGVQSALHQYLVKPGRIPSQVGRFFDEMFKDRQDGDYGMFVDFEPSVVQERLNLARQFVDEMKRLLDRTGQA